MNIGGIYINIRDIKTIHIDDKDPTIVVVTYLNNGGTTNINSGDIKTAKENFEYLSKETARIQNKPDSIFDKLI